MAIVAESAVSTSEEKLLESRYTDITLCILHQKEDVSVEDYQVPKGFQPQVYRKVEKPSKLSDLYTYYRTGGRYFELKRDYKVWEQLEPELNALVDSISIVSYKSEYEEERPNFYMIKITQKADKQVEISDDSFPILKDPSISKEDK